MELLVSGPSPKLSWTKASQLAADHVRAGSFESACRLLHDQIGVVNFKPYDSVFQSLYSSSRTVSNHLANLPPIFSYPLRNWKDATVKTGLPAIGISLNDLVAKLQVTFREFRFWLQMLTDFFIRFVIN